MVRQAFLMVKLLSEDRHKSRIQVRGQLFDDSPFDINVASNKVLKIEDDPENRAWLRVDHLGEQTAPSGSTAIAAIQLPTPDITYGARVNVKTSQLELDITSRTNKGIVATTYDTRTADIKDKEEKQGIVREDVGAQHVHEENKDTESKCCEGTGECGG